MAGVPGQSPHKGQLRRATAVLALAALSTQARQSQPVQERSRAVPTVVFLPAVPMGQNLARDLGDRFRATAQRDLADSGLFKLLDPAEVSGGTESATLPFWRCLGADLLVRSVTRAPGPGRLSIEGECVDLATEAVVLRRHFTGETAVVSRMAHRFAVALIGTVTGIPGSADSTLVYARRMAPGVQEIFGVAPDGDSPRRLTAFGSLTSHPALAADGRLACVTYKGGPPQIWGQTRRQGPFQRLYPSGDGPGSGLSGLAWAPDGNRLAFVRDAGQGGTAILVLDVASGQAVRISGKGRASWDPCWNPAGSRIAFLAEAEGTPQVFTMADDGSQAQCLTHDIVPKECVAWDVQNDRLAFAARNNGNSDLYLMATDGRVRSRIASLPERVESMGWAPDGRALVLGTMDGDHVRICIVRLDGSVRKLTAAADGGQFPHWARNPRVEDPGG